MRIFKTRWFAQWAKGERITDTTLCAAVDEMTCGLVDANLGGHVFKKRIAIRGRGKSGGLRTLLAFRSSDRAFFMYGFARNERADVGIRELQALKLLARQLLNYDAKTLEQAMVADQLYEVTNHE
jgi:hypothetical protein